MPSSDVTRPRIIIIAGPNGAGKTTFAREYLPREGACLEFLNADLIAAGLSPFAPERVAVSAGRLMLHSMADHLAARDSFSFETTLSGMTYSRQIPRWRMAGHHVQLCFLRLPDPDFAVSRVAVRVSQGGHHIPEDVIRRRFEAGWRLFNSVYKGLVDEWLLYDSSGDSATLLERGHVETNETVREPQAGYAGLPPDASEFLKGTYAALQRAGRRARELARQTGTPLVLWRDGKTVIRQPDSNEP